MINKVDLKDENSFYELGLLINEKFPKLFNLGDLLSSNLDYVFGYYDNEKLVGFIHINKLYENIDIINIVVDKSYRRKGIATQLINHVIGYFDDVKSIMLEVNVNNENAINLYKVNKFEVINVRKKYYGNDDALIMRRDV